MQDEGVLSSTREYPNESGGAVIVAVLYCIGVYWVYLSGALYSSPSQGVHSLESVSLSDLRALGVMLANTAR